VWQLSSLYASYTGSVSDNHLGGHWAGDVSAKWENIKLQNYTEGGWLLPVAAQYLSGNDVGK
jgi:hypothetical protein